MDREVHHLHYLLDGVFEASSIEVRREVSVFDQLLVKEVVNVHHDELT